MEDSAHNTATSITDEEGHAPLPLSTPNSVLSQREFSNANENNLHIDMNDSVVHMEDDATPTETMPDETDDPHPDEDAVFFQSITDSYNNVPPKENILTDATLPVLKGAISISSRPRSEGDDMEAQSNGSSTSQQPQELELATAQTAVFDNARSNGNNALRQGPSNKSLRKSLTSTIHRDPVRRNSTASTIPPPPPQAFLTRSNPRANQPGAVPIGISRRPSNSTIEIGGDTVVQSQEALVHRQQELAQALPVQSQSDVEAMVSPVIVAVLVEDVVSEPQMNEESSSSSPYVSLPYSSLSPDTEQSVSGLPLASRRKTSRDLIKDWRVSSVVVALLVVIAGLSAGLAIGLSNSNARSSSTTSSSQNQLPPNENPDGNGLFVDSPSISPAFSGEPTVVGGTPKPTTVEEGLSFKPPTVDQTFRPTNPGEGFADGNGEDDNDGDDDDTEDGLTDSNGGDDGATADDEGDDDEDSTNDSEGDDGLTNGDDDHDDDHDDDSDRRLWLH